MKTAQPPPDVLSVIEATRVLGISRTTVYKLMDAGRLPGRKIGRKTVIMRRDIAAFLDNLPKY